MLRKSSDIPGAIGQLLCPSFPLPTTVLFLMAAKFRGSLQTTVRKGCLGIVLVVGLGHTSGPITPRGGEHNSRQMPPSFRRPRACEDDVIQTSPPAARFGPLTVERKFVRDLRKTFSSPSTEVLLGNESRIMSRCEYESGRKPA